MTSPRVLIEEWLPAAAIAVECMRERSTGQQPPDKRLHVWWARRPLTISRAAVLGSLLPADFDRACFERLLGFYASSDVIVKNAEKLEIGSGDGGRIANPHGPRAFSNFIPQSEVQGAIEETCSFWGDTARVIDPMAGGGSIPLEAARLGLDAFANELNSVACSVLEATVDYPFNFGVRLAEKTRTWAKQWREAFVARMSDFYHSEGVVPAYSYIFARTVPCPDTGHPTPLVPDWSLSRPKGKLHIVAQPVVTDPATGKWTINVKQVGKAAGQLWPAPAPTYSGGKGISLFTKSVIPADYIKAMAQSGKMGSVLYAVAVKAAKLEFRPPEEADLAALEAAERELARLRPQWERDNIIPTEEYPQVTTDPRPRVYGMPRWADMFSPRQLLALGTLVEELNRLRPEIISKEGEELGEAIVHLLAMAFDKFADYNTLQATWECTRLIVKHGFQRHDFSFKPTYAEMAACVAGSGLEWAIDNVLDAYQKLAALPKAGGAKPVT